MPKNVFITGITGMVGSHLLDYLLENTDWTIFGLCRWRSQLDNIKHLIPLIEEKKRIHLIYGDINDYISLNYAIEESQPNFVFHLAAQSYPQTSFTSPIDTLNTNILGTAKLLECIKKAKLDPVIHVCASSEVFGRVSKEDLPIHENINFHPASPYAISKVGTDLIGRFYGEAYNLRCITTRMFTHTGPRRGDVFAESSFAKQIALIESGQINPTIKTGNLNSLRTFADVRDAVDAYYKLVTINPIPGEFYNIGGNFSCTIGEMLDTLIGYSTVKNIKIVTEKSRLRPIDADLQVPDTKKFKKHTGWEPKYSFEDTMKDLLDYWRKRISDGEKFTSR